LAWGQLWVAWAIMRGLASSPPFEAALWLCRARGGRATVLHMEPLTGSRKITNTDWAHEEEVKCKELLRATQRHLNICGIGR